MIGASSKFVGLVTVIHKYPVIAGVFVLDVPAGPFQIVHAGPDSLSDLSVWIRQSAGFRYDGEPSKTTGPAPQKVRFMAVGTDYEIEPDRWQHVGTLVATAGGLTVWHLLCEVL